MLQYCSHYGPIMFLIWFHCFRHSVGILLLLSTCPQPSFNFLRMVIFKRFIINGLHTRNVPCKSVMMITNYRLRASGACSLYVALHASLLLLCFSAEFFFNSEDLAHRSRNGMLRTLNLTGQDVHLVPLALKT